jgi:periplasmic protein TonB
MTSERAWNWVDGIAHRLIRCAARRTPDSLSQRLEEEWLADLAAQRGAIARLRFAFGCCWATNIIAREQAAVAALPATSSAAGQGYFIRTASDDFPFFTTRTITFVLVASLHAAVLYGLAMGLGPKFTKIMTAPFVTRVIEAPPRSSLPPPPRPQISPTRIELPPPETMPSIDSDPTDVVAATSSEPPHSALVPSVPPQVNRVQGGPGIGFPSTDDFYPDASIRGGDKGVATVRACVDGKGRLISEPTIIQSTGSTRLDEGALRLAKAGSGHYRATTEDGQPVNSCYPFRIRFELH